MILYLNTAEPETRIALFSTNGELCIEDVWTTARNHSDELLRHIDNLLKTQSIKPQDLTGILIFPGPGSYTGLRVGITTANFLAFSLNIPILAVGENESVSTTIQPLDSARGKQFNNLTIFQSPVMPIYPHPPHITKPKSSC